jgi:Uma2 family endonuclease
MRHTGGSSGQKMNWRNGMTPTLPTESVSPVALDFLDSFPKDLPESDGVPTETAWQRDQMFLSIDLLETNWKGKRFYCGGNMFIHYALEQVRRRKFLGSDFFVVNNVDHDRMRKYWAVWEEDGRYPNFILELLSRTTADEDLTTKKDIYEQTFGTHEYVCYDPETDELQGWRLLKRYRPIAIESGRIWCESLELWKGRFSRQRGHLAALL